MTSFRAIDAERERLGLAADELTRRAGVNPRAYADGVKRDAMLRGETRNRLQLILQAEEIKRAK